MVLARPGQGSLLGLVDILLVDVACPFFSPSPLSFFFFSTSALQPGGEVRARYEGGWLPIRKGKYVWLLVPLAPASAFEITWAVVQGSTSAVGRISSGLQHGKKSDEGTSFSAL
jgi:hypothetical protein